MADCLTCSDNPTLEEIYRLITYCDGDLVYYKVRQIPDDEDYSSESCLDCLKYLSPEEIIRRALFCDIAGIHSVQVKVYEDVEADCDLCDKSLSLEEILRLLIVCNAEVFAIKVVVVVYEEECAVCGTYNTVEEWVRRALVCDVEGNYYLRVGALTIS